MIHSFLLIGQSNMAGRGFIDEVEQISNPRLKVLRNGRWQGMYVPVNCDRAFSGVSLAESFADIYSKEHNVDVGLIPCADGGTSLDQWRVGGLLYDHAVYQTKLAMRTSTVAGVLWHQGEADCSDNLYPFYEEKFVKIMNGLRKELNLYDVPFILGGLGTFLADCIFDDKLKNYTYVNKALENIAKHNEMTGFVCADGLTSNPDKLHFNSKSLREFGKRYYAEFLKLEDKNKIFIEKLSEDDAVRTAMEEL
jgi:hypothetical protein